MNPSEIPYGEPCPICGPEGHQRHVDDSYGGCVTCVEYVPHTDADYERVAFPCPASKMSDYEAAVDALEEISLLEPLLREQNDVTAGDIARAALARLDKHPSYGV